MKTQTFPFLTQQEGKSFTLKNQVTEIENIFSAKEWKISHSTIFTKFFSSFEKK